MFHFRTHHRIKSLALTVLFAFILSFATYHLFFDSLTLSPTSEARQIENLERTKQQISRTKFISDGCSGNVSFIWEEVITELSSLSSQFATTYSDAQTIPFETSCVEHDKSYHEGDSGYVGRLQADNRLRQAIIEYGIGNAQEIKQRAGLNTPEEAVFLYEVMAEAVYRGVRLGGAACTGKPYAWGYGYGGGNCI